MELGFQFLQLEELRFVVGTVHVVDLELPKIAHHDPPGILVMGQISGVSSGLLERGEHRPIRLAGSFLEIDILAFLLDQHPCGGNEPVDETGMAQHDRHFKFNKLAGVLHPQDILE